MKTLCVFHANCVDGFGAAWAVRKAIPEAEFYAATHQEPPPDVAGKRVVMVDFAYKRPVLLDMASTAESILILDHHKSAAEDLELFAVDLCGAARLVHADTEGMFQDLKELAKPPVIALFDMERSGAMMAWQYFFPGVSAPRLIEHIQDRDLWRFSLPGTREIQANLFSYPYDFEVWDKLMAMDVGRLWTGGKAIERKHHKDIAELVTVCKRRMSIGGFDVPAANLPYTYSSDAGHLMAQGEPFSACWWITQAGVVFSLRSATDGVDVSEIAKGYGGGGHRNAAGFTISVERFVGWINSESP